MLVKAINNNQSTTLPGLTTHATVNYLKNAHATDKGQMKRLRQGIRLTKSNPPENKIGATIHNNIREILQCLFSLITQQTLFWCSPFLAQQMHP